MPSHKQLKIKHTIGSTIPTIRITFHNK